MTSRNLSNPPIIDTNIPTNDGYVNSSTPSYVGRDYVLDTFYPLPKPDRSHRYNISDGYMAAVDRFPAGFADGKYVNGVAAIVCLPKVDTLYDVRLAAHPIAGHVSGYSDGWTLSDSPVNDVYWNSNVGAPYLSPQPSVALGAQRLGTRVYSLMLYQDSTKFYYLNAVFNGAYYTYQYVLLSESYGSLRLTRFDGLNSSDTLIWGMDSEIYSTNQGDGAGAYYDDNGVYAPLYADSTSDIFVSDDEEPFVWLRETHYGAEYVTGFWDNRTSANPAWNNTTFITSVYAPPQAPPFPPLTSGTYVTYTSPFLGWVAAGGAPPVAGRAQIAGNGQLGAFRQALPANAVSGRLVHRWACGDYGAPELWLVVPAGGGVYKIYAAPWVRGAWTSPPTGWAFTDGQLDGGVRFPTYNKFGYGFDMRLDAAHEIGSVTLPGNPQFTGKPDFHFSRDTDSPDVMHLVVCHGDVNVVYVGYSGLTPSVTTNATSAWTFVSPDDGNTWSVGVKVKQPPSTVLLTGHVNNRSSAVRAAENVTLIAVTDRLNTGSGAVTEKEFVNPGPGGSLSPAAGGSTEQRCAFISCDQSTNPVAHGERNGIIFKRGENKGTVAWL